jgi:hypothetical protein
MKNQNNKEQVVSPLERFWHDQNQKLIANDGFRDDLGTLFDDTFYFIHSRGYSSKTSLDFSLFDLDHIKIENAAALTLDGKIYPLSLKEYAKLAVVTSITPKATGNARYAFNSMAHAGGFLNTQGSKVLSQGNIEAFHISYLTQSVSDKGWSTLLSSPGYSAIKGFNFVDHRKRLHALGVTGVVDQTVTKNKLSTTLNNACQSVMGITRLEYSQGGSFNALTLDMGQYYVDHMKKVFEQDYFYTLVCQSAIRLVLQKFDLENKTGISHQNSAIVKSIQGTYVRTKRTQPRVISYNAVHDAMNFALFEQYSIHFDKVQSLKEENICQVVRELGLDMRFDSVEIIRVLMLQKYYDFGACKTPESVWLGYLRSLDKTEIESNKLKYTTAHDVYTLMSKVVTAHRLDIASFMSSLAQWASALNEGKREETYQELTKGFNRVNDAMTSLVVAWLGYRKSEFGFPLSAIHVVSNLDILDNSHVPFRFKLKWVVPKTSGETKIDREITSQCYQVAAQLNDALQTPEGDPCLYVVRRKKGVSSSHVSEMCINRRVRSNWSHFVTNYEPFVDVYELQRLSNMPCDALSHKEQETLYKLRDQYDLSSARSKHLLSARDEVKRDIAKLNCTTIIGDKKQKAFKISLEEYCQTGDISNPDHKQMVSKYLSDETKKWLQSEGVNLDQKGMQDISHELLQGVRYPTPHAFRHIWAEAVLTRYQGDVGAVIRHQFCHMDESFFMAYLRDKEVKGLMQVARINLLNSIVDTLLIDSKQIGSEYLGGFSRYVKKAASLTQAVTIADLRLLRERIEGRIISIQPSLYATCIPREGGEGRAKCAVMRDINPHNAKPSFCLGCTNAVITSGNIKGIWVTIQPFVKECLREDVLGFMVQWHLPTLRSGYKRIKEMQSSANAESVGVILSHIDDAIKSVEEKLKAEDRLYA